MQSKTIDELLDQIIDKHTIALTKTTEFNREVVSFDTVVLNQYEAKQDIKKLILSEVLACLAPAIDRYEVANGWLVKRNQLIDEITTAIKKRFGEENEE